MYMYSFKGTEYVISSDSSHVKSVSDLIRDPLNIPVVWVQTVFTV